MGGEAGRWVVDHEKRRSLEEWIIAPVLWGKTKEDMQGKNLDCIRGILQYAPAGNIGNKLGVS